MEMMDLTKMLRLSDDAILYGLKSRITEISMDALQESLDACKKDDILRYFNFLTADSQINVLSNSIYYDTLKKLCGKIDNCKLDVLFNNMENIEVLQSCEIEDIIKLSQEDKISSIYWHIYLKDLKNESEESLNSIFAGFDVFHANIKDIDDEWLISVKDIAMLPFIISDKFLNHTNYKTNIELLASRPDIVKLLGYIYALNDTAYISVNNFEQICADSNEIFELLKEVCASMSIGRQYDFITVWLENSQLLYDLKVLQKKINNDTDYRFTNDIVRYVSFCYGDTLDIDVEQYQSKVMIYAISHKKKAFIKLIKNNLEVFKTIPPNSILFNPVFYEKCINLNTLNINNLKDLAHLIYYHNRDAMMADASTRGFTFAEFSELYKVSDKLYKIYIQLESKSVDYKLIVLKELEAHSSIISNEHVDLLPKFLNNKKLSDWHNQDFGHISDLDYKTLLQIFQNYPENITFLKDVDSCIEAKRICENFEQYKNMQDLQEVRESVLKTDKNWLELKVLLDISDEFVEENKESIRRFVINNGAYIFHKFLQSRSSEKKNVKRLFNAEVLGKFYELKYHTGDLSKELSIDISEGVQNNWQRNYKVCNSKFTVWEEDRLLPVMQIGEIPTSTCLSYKDGAYNECLLSNFDTNKKIIFASKDNQIVFRAVLRLTKGNTKIPSRRQLEFYDVTGESKQAAGKERILIFLERAYVSSINDTELGEIFSLVHEMLQQKAKDMKVVLVCSNSYKSIQNSLIKFTYNIYISRSKIGRQYLDSLGGSASSYDECKYIRTEILVDSNSLKLLE